MATKKILITLGDPNGIGLEVTLKCLALFPLEIHNYISVIGLAKSWDPYIHLYPNITFYSVLDEYIPEPGILSVHAGRVALKSLDLATILLKQKKYQGLLTAPISKEAIYLSGKKDFIGHTEYLGQAFNVQTEMLFWSPKWSVLLLTSHISLQDVSKKITKERCEKIFNLAIDFNKKYYQQKIAVCGLNPHAGENGLMGDTEKTIFAPIIKKLALNHPISGPYSPDAIFHKAEKGEFSVLIASYHDQALIPFKLLHFHDGVNVTLGLPFVRTSPDHGTAFDIANKNKANPQSMISALNFIALELNLPQYLSDK